MLKNVGSQKVAVYAWDTVNRTAKTGNAAAITGKISKDGGAAAAIDDTNPTELDSTAFPGIYLFDVTSSETNADLVVIQAASTSTSVQILPVINYTIVDVRQVSGEPGQGAPAVSTSLSMKIDYLYKAWRNKKTQDATTFKLFDDAGATVDQKATVSDDGTAFTFGEIGSGP